MKTEDMFVGMTLRRIEHNNGRRGARIGQEAKVIGFYKGWPVVEYEGRKTTNCRIGDKHGEAWCPAFCEAVN